MKPGVLLVGNFLSAKGANPTMAEDMAQHLESAGYTLVTTSRIRSRFLRLLDMLFVVFSRRRDYQLACVEVYSGAAFIWAELVCGLLGVLRKPYILTLHGGNLPIFARRWPWRIRQLLQSASAVTAPSRYLQAEMRPYHEDVLLIPNPLDVENYTFRQRSTPSLRLIWLRAFHSIYHPQMAPLVIAALRTTFPDIFLTMIGPDKGDGSLPETRSVIEKLALQRNVEIIPGIPKRDVPEYLGHADIFINTTNVDNTPVSVLEALACGLCVVSTDVGGLPYLLQDGQDALLVSPNDPAAMAKAIERILTEPGLAARLSQNAWQKTQVLDWSVILPQWEELLKRSLGHGT